MKIIYAIYQFLKFFVLKSKYDFLCRKCKTKINDIFIGSEKDALLLTHNYGGGTLTYENNLISESKENFIVLRIISYRKNLAMKIERDGKTFYLSAKLLESVFKNKFKSVIVNSLLGFYHNEKFIPFLAEYKRKNPDVRFTVMMHDFYPVCPHFNLVADNWNCNLVCENHKCKFDNFVEKFNGTILEWRSIWMKFLPNVDEIRCFSNSSKKIVKEAYPALQEEKITVVPHSLDYIKFTPIKNVEKLPLHIGIVGAIKSVPKGKLVVHELLRRIPEKIPISIIGATKRDIGGINRKNTKYLGKYNHDDLQKLVESETISMEIFPSIWSETFSYLVSEHIAMNEPVVCFDMGAQAEKVRAYKKGIVVKTVDEMVDVIAGNGNMSTNEQIIQDDSPITSIDEDKFDRKQFVENLAKALQPTDKSTDSKVIALTGSWGVGKTSVINMVKNEIKKNTNNKLFIINFNPWQYTKNDDLIKPFLEEIALGCKKIKRRVAKYYKNFDTKSVSEHFTESITAIVSFLGILVSILESKTENTYVAASNFVNNLNFLQIIVSLLPVLMFIGLFVFSLAKLIHTFFSANLNTERGNLTKQKNQISSFIKKRNYHLIIVVDDIDRLTPEETLQMFRIIRSNADFVNTTYLVAFDKNIVTENLNKSNINGNGFIEKIITSEYQLFEPAKFYLRKYMSDGVKEIFENLNINEKQKTLLLDDEEKYRSEKIIDCMSEALKTMRDIKRYLNSLALYSNIICHEGLLEVNFIDFGALECIHLKYVDCYYGIQKNKKLLTSSENEIAQNKDIDVKSIIEGFAKSDIEQRLFLLLFPAFTFEFRDKIRFGLPANPAEESQKNRICSPKYFDEYFSSGINLDDHEHISNKELFEFESLSYDKNKMLDFLRKSLKKEKLTGFLELLKDVCTSRNFIINGNASHFIAAMFETECFEPYGHKIFFERNNRDICKEIVNSYLHQFLTDEKLLKEIIVQAAGECDCVYPIAAFICKQVQSCENQNADFLFEKSDINELKQIAINKLSNYKEKTPDKFWNDEDLLENLLFWQALDKNGFKNEMASEISTDEKLSELMIKLYKKRFNKTQQDFPYREFAYFGDLENFKRQLETALKENKLNEDCSLIAEYFLKNFQFREIIVGQIGDERLRKFNEEDDAI